MHKVVLAGAVLALAVVSVTDASACSRRSRVCGAYAPAPVYQYAPPPAAYYGPPPAAYYAPPPAAAAYAYPPPAYSYVPAAGYYGYRDCDRGNGYRYGSPAAYDDYGDYRPAAVWVPVR